MPNFIDNSILHHWKRFGAQRVPVTHKPGFVSKYTRLGSVSLLGLILLMGLISAASAQNPVEDLLDAESADAADESYLEEIERLLANPIDLNTAQRSDLLQIPNLPVPVLQAILEFRAANGPFETPEDIRQVPGVTARLYATIEPFVTVEQREKREFPIHGVIRFRYASRDSNPDDFDSFYTYYQRVLLSYNDWLKVGVLAEKDPGETVSLTSSQPDWDDLLLWHLAVDRPDWPVRAIVGHYKIEAGQGLLFSPAGGLFKGGEVVNGTKKRFASIRPYTSTSENDGFFGLTVAGDVGPVSLFLFGSEIDRDATLSEANAYTVRSFYETGLHRTETERAKKDAVTESLYGLHTRYQTPNGSSIGVTYYQSEFDKVIYPEVEDRTFYRFRGDELAGYSVDVDLFFDQLNVFGEVAQSADHGRGWAVGATIDLQQFEITALLRDYDVDFYTFHSYGFADSKGSTDNENGQFIGIRWRLPYRVKLWAYADYFRHPFRRYLTPVPDNGSEYYSQLEFPVSPKLKTTIRVRSKTKLDSYQRSDWYPSTKSNYRVQLDWKPDKRYQFRFRYEYVTTRGDEIDLDDSGNVLYGDVKWQPITPLQLYARLIFYDTDSSQAPVYVFENDLPGVLRNTYLAGEGRRWYLMGKYKLWTKSYLSAKVSQKTAYETRDQFNTPRTDQFAITDWAMQLDLFF